MTHAQTLRAALPAVVILSLAACHPKPPPPTAPTDSPAAAAASDKQGVTFGDGFYKEETDSAAPLRWVRQNAALSVDAPAEGRYKLTFRPFTVFTTVENTIEVTVNGQPAGSFSTRVFDLSNPVPTTLEVPLHAGNNAVQLRSRGAEHRMSDSDDRQVAYGLVVPVAVERAP